MGSGAAVDEALARSRRFQVLRRRGAGGMGVVYEVLDRQRAARLALKTLHALRGDALLRFKHEFRALADLDHPNLVSLAELVEEDGHWFFTMELVEGVGFLEHVRPGGAARVPASPSMAYGETLDGTGSDPAAAPAAPAAPGAPVHPAVAASALDEPRLRAALPQLAQGVAALHAARLVHRDLKPSNVLVDGDGRVVVLDFGLVTDAHARPGDDAPIVGTAAYMAPEQAAGLAVGPAADWYAVGVMLYEALTGRTPFPGGPVEVLMAKQRWEPPPPRAHAPGVPADLDALCVALLRTEPERRPPGPEVLARLGADLTAAGAAATATLSRSWPSHGSPFVGRAAELAAARAAFAAVQAGGTVSLLVAGPSGIGKSTLAREVVARLRAEAPGLTALHGRCYERESVSYKAVDPLVDALARHLARLPAADAAALAPRGAALLAQVFPVLRSVPAFAEAPRPAPAGADPHEQRRRLFAALRELLGRLAERAPLVLVIDDLQWADDDSLALLGALLEPPGAPALLLLATMRDDAPELARVALPGDVRRLALAPLAPAEAEDLARRLCGDGADAAAIAGEAAGHPLFIDELARHGRAALTIDAAIWSRCERLDPAARDVLELVAVAGAPLPQSACARAAGADAADFMRRLALLRAGRLCRTSGTRGTDVVEPYHDRVREAVAMRLADDRRAARHAALARALEAEPVPDDEALAMHWRAAGHPGRAADHAALAARRAHAALAFDRAARLYRLAIELGAPAGAGLASLHAALGDALAALGRGRDAADAYRRAAEAEGAPRADALELLRRAAEHQLHSGHFDEGVELLRVLLEPLGMRMPASPRLALASLLVGRARLVLRGLGFRERDRSQIAAEALTRVDLTWSAAVGLGMCDPFYGADFQTRHLRLALDTGEPYRIARALAVEAVFVSTAGQRAQTRALGILEQADALARRAGNPHAVGLAQAARAMVLFQVADFRATIAAAEPGARYLREQCTGAYWELALADFYTLLSLSWLGRFAEIRRRFPPILRDAEARGDRFADTFLRMALYCHYLALDQPDEGERQVEQALAGWSRQGFHIQHFVALIARAQIHFYRGDVLAAHRLVEDTWPALERSLLLRLENNRMIAVELRARAALGMARRAPDPRARRPLLRLAARCRRTMAGIATGWSRAAQDHLAGAFAELGGRPADAARAYVDAAHRFEQLDMRLHAAAASLDAHAAAPEDAAITASWHTAAALLREEGAADAARLARVQSARLTAD